MKILNDIIDLTNQSRIELEKIIDLFGFELIGRNYNSIHCYSDYGDATTVEKFNYFAGCLGGKTILNDNHLSFLYKDWEFLVILNGTN